MEEVSKAECFERFPEEWVCLEVVEKDEARQTKRGRVVAHDPSEEKVLDAERLFRRQHPGVATYVFFAGPVVDPNADVVVIV